MSTDKDKMSQSEYDASISSALKKAVWVTRDQQKIPVVKMTSSHLRSALVKLREKNLQHLLLGTSTKKDQEYIALLEEEIKRRPENDDVFLGSPEVESLFPDE